MRHDLYTLLHLPNDMSIIVVNVHLAHKEENYKHRAGSLKNIIQVLSVIYSSNTDPKLKLAY